jgi:hypothetical protein
MAASERLVRFRDQVLGGFTGLRKKVRFDADANAMRKIEVRAISMHSHAACGGSNQTQVIFYLATTLGQPVL